jgi:perosamine synthetase
MVVAPTAAGGAVPRFYPIDERGHPALDALEPAVIQGARAILVPHLFGLPQPMARIRQWCDDRGIALIEDCAHAMFGTSDGKPIGSWGDAAIGSLTKFLPVPEGGCLVLKSHLTAPALRPRSGRAQLKALLDIIEDGARHGRLSGFNTLITSSLEFLRRRRAKAASKLAAPATSNGDLDPIEAGFVLDIALAHSQLTQACARVAAHMPRAWIVQRRQAHYRHLAAALSGLPGMRPLMPDLPDGAVPYVFPLWVEQPDPGYQALRAQRIPIFRWDRLWPGTPSIPGDCGWDWSHHVIQLACHQDLSSTDLDAIVSTVKTVYSRGA